MPEELPPLLKAGAGDGGRGLWRPAGVTGPGPPEAGGGEEARRRPGTTSDEARRLPVATSDQDGADRRRGRGRRARWQPVRSGPAGEVVTGVGGPTVATGKVTGAGGVGGEVGNGRGRVGDVVANEARTGEMLVEAGG